MQELAINRNRAQTAVRHWEVKQAAAKDRVDAAKVEEGRAERELTVSIFIQVKAETDAPIRNGRLKP
jgi:hypothetical protein